MIGLLIVALIPIVGTVLLIGLDMAHKTPNEFNPVRHPIRPAIPQQRRPEDLNQ